MKRITCLVIVALVFASASHAGTPKVEVAFAKDKDSKPTQSFDADALTVNAFFKTTGTKKGDSLRCVWIADDIGEAAPKGIKISESKVTADEADFNGSFSLSKPTKGWPVGKYHVDIYAGDQVVTSAQFTITAEAEE